MHNLDHIKNGIDQVLERYGLDRESQCRLHDFLMGMNAVLYMVSAGSGVDFTPEALNRYISMFVKEILCCPVESGPSATGGD